MCLCPPSSVKRSDPLGITDRSERIGRRSAFAWIAPRCNDTYDSDDRSSLEHYLWHGSRTQSSLTRRDEFGVGTLRSNAGPGSYRRCRGEENVQTRCEASRRRSSETEACRFSRIPATAVKRQLGDH